MPKAIISKCRMCGLVKKLVDSHIIPKAFYTQDKQMAMFVERYGKKLRIPFPQGVYDQIICHECEEKFKSIDDYGIKLLRHGKLGAIGKSGVFYYPRADYGKLKQFILSIIYRAHLSTRPEYAEFYLSERQLKLISDIIFGSNVGPDTFFPMQFKYFYDFPCMMIVQPAWKINKEFITLQLNNIVVQVKANLDPSSLLIYLSATYGSYGIRFQGIPFEGSNLEKQLRRWVIEN